MPLSCPWPHIWPFSRQLVPEQEKKPRDICRNRCGSLKKTTKKPKHSKRGSAWSSLLWSVRHIGSSVRPRCPPGISKGCVTHSPLEKRVDNVWNNWRQQMGRSKKDFSSLMSSSPQMLNIFIPCPWFTCCYEALIIPATQFLSNPEGADRETDAGDELSAELKFTLTFITFISNSSSQTHSTRFWTFCHTSLKIFLSLYTSGPVRVHLNPCLHKTDSKSRCSGHVLYVCVEFLMDSICMLVLRKALQASCSSNPPQTPQWTKKTLWISLIWVWKLVVIWFLSIKQELPI